MSKRFSFAEYLRGYIFTWLAGYSRSRSESFLLYRFWDSENIVYKNLLTVFVRVKQLVEKKDQEMINIKLDFKDKDRFFG